MELVAEGNTVAGRFRCSGTHQGEFLGEAPTGERMDVEEVFFLRAEDGRFVDFWGLEDSLGRMPSRHRSTGEAEAAGDEGAVRRRIAAGATAVAASASASRGQGRRRAFWRITEGADLHRTARTI